MMSPATASKPSRYNSFARRGDGAFICHNLLRGTTFKVGASPFSSISGLFERECPHQVIDELPMSVRTKLADLGFIVDQDEDEVSLIKTRYYETLFGANGLHLVLLPTLWCNLDCPYCFEYKRRETMSEEVMRSLKTWIETQFTEKRAINVGWFGGEPLLSKSLIVDLSAFFIDFSQKIGAKYNASITTNGYFLDERFSRQLDKHQIRHVQVTLDGAREFHDLTRKHRNGKGSFDRIKENIEGFHSSGTKCGLTVRVNCTDDNIDSIPELIDCFSDEVKSRTFIFFRWVWANEASGYRQFAAKSRGQEPFARLAALYDYASKAGWIIRNPITSHNPVYCEADYLDHYTVTPNGDVFFCTHTFNSSERLSNLLDRKIQNHKFFPEKTPFTSRWFGTDCFGTQECLDCKVLPICKGGCRKERVEGRKTCIEEKQSLDRYILNAANAAGLR
jgi:uncharacterized protein